MIEFLKSWVLNIVTIVMFIVILEIMIPSGKVKKFINLISGFVVLIAIINPFLNIFAKGIDLREFQFSNSNFIDKKEIESNSKILEDHQMKQITEVFRQKVINQLIEEAKDVEGIADAKADLIINEDYKSDKFGEIKKVYLSLKLVDENTGVKSVAKVEPVEINSSKNLETEIVEINKDIKNEIEKKINKLLDVEKENIIITLQET